MCFLGRRASPLEPVITNTRLPTHTMYLTRGRRRNFCLGATASASETCIVFVPPVFCNIKTLKKEVERQSVLCGFAYTHQCELQQKHYKQQYHQRQRQTKRSGAGFGRPRRHSLCQAPRADDGGGERVTGRIVNDTINARGARGRMASSRVETAMPPSHRTSPLPPLLQLELARKPRVVSMSAIYGDFKQLGNDLVEQSRGARDDIVQRASEHVEKVCVK